METFHANGTPLATYLEGEGFLETTLNGNADSIEALDRKRLDHGGSTATSFAPSSNVEPISYIRRTFLRPTSATTGQETAIGRVYIAWSKAVNSRLGRADNARFIEHFRYIIVASQLLNEYLDQGSLPPTIPNHGLDGASDSTGIPSVRSSLFGAAATAIVAFALVYLIHWARSGRDSVASKSRVTLVLILFLVSALVGYAYIRRQWLKLVRRHAVVEVNNLTASLQAFEVSTSSALSLIQEVELVSKGYRLSTPLPPASRIEDQATARRCARLRKSLHKAYTAVIPAATDTCSSIRNLIEEDDLDKYFEVYDISAHDAREASGCDALSVLEDDPESLKSLRVLSYRAGVLRRVVLCSLMALEADGGKPDFLRWRLATEGMCNLSKVVGPSAEKLQTCLSEMETVATPITPVNRSPNFPVRDKMRSQVRKISMLSSGIRGLQAKMQILREETNRSMEQSEDLADLGPSLMAQYESIGTDLKELMQAWEAGKASLQNNLTKQERRISMGSSLLSPMSSIGGLTAVDEGGTPEDALKALTGDSVSNRSSMGTTTTTSDDEVFEAVAMPRQRTTLTREERIFKMQEERERQATLRSKRDANTSMLRELESVINLRPKNNPTARITSI